MVRSVHAEAVPDIGSGRPARPAEPDATGAPEADAASRDRVFRLSLALGLAPLIVGAVASVVLVGGDYHPTGDLAMTEMHVRDVGRHEVLVGLHSRPFWSHPGPLQFYLLAPFYRLAGGSSIGLVLGALAINGASVAGILAVARRRGGTPLLLCSLVACLVLMRTLGPEVLGDAWNLTLTVLPLLLLAFLGWSLLCGDAWALPVGAFVTSFLVQTHVGLAATAAPLYAGAALWFAAGAWRDRRSANARRLARTVALTAAVVAVVWLPPVIDVVRHSPSNATKIFDYFQDPPEATHSLAEGWRVTTGQFGLTSEWLTGKLTPATLSGESPYLHSSPAPLILLPLAAAAVFIVRRRRGDAGLVVTTLALTALVLLSVVRTIGPIADYRLRYTWVPPVLAAITILWAGWLACSRWRPASERAMAGLAVGAAAVLCCVTAVSAARAGTPHAADSRVAEAVSDPVVAAFAGAEGQVVVDELIGYGGVTYSRALVLQLERHGIDARVPPSRATFFSPNRVHGGGPVAAHLLVATGADVERLLRRSELRLLVRWNPPGPSPDPVDPAVEEAWRAGDLSPGEYMAAVAEAGGNAGGHEGGQITSGTGQDVAVFVDERPLAGRPGSMTDLSAEADEP